MNLHRAILLLSLAAPIAEAGEDVDETRAAPPDAVVRISNTRGDVSIQGWARAEVRVHGELDDLAEKLEFAVNGRDVLISVQMPRSNVNWGDGSDLHISVPKGARVTFEGVSTDVRARNIDGGLQVRTVSGDIDVADVSSQFVLNSTSGDVVVVSSSGRAKVGTISGDIELSLNSAEVQVESVSGDIDIELDGFQLLNARNVSGGTRVEGGLGHAGRVDMASVSGDILLALKRPINAALKVTSSISGGISNGFSDAVPTVSFPRRHELLTQVGDGSALVTISTVSADVRLD